MFATNNNSTVLESLPKCVYYALKILLVEYKFVIITGKSSSSSTKCQ